MFNFRLNPDVPGFRVNPDEDVPGFRVGPDGSTPSDIVPVAAGDLACEGFRGGCESGGDYGTTAAYRAEGRRLCMKCALRKLGFENEPSSAQPGLLQPWSLQRK